MDMGSVENTWLWEAVGNWERKVGPHSIKVLNRPGVRFDLEVACTLLKCGSGRNPNFVEIIIELKGWRRNTGW